MTETDDTADGKSSPKRRRLQRIAGLIGVLLLLAIVVPFVIYAVPQTVGADHSYVVLSGSMEPTMNPGDAVIVKDVPVSEIEEGDIITFSREEQETPTTHRVVDVVQQDGGVAFKTAGDNNEDPDQQLTTPGDVKGRVPVIAGTPFVIPLIGYAINFAASQSGFTLLFVIPIGLLIVTEIWSMSKKLRGDESSGDDGDSSAVGGATQASGESSSRPTVGTNRIEEPPVTHVDSAAVSHSYGSPTATNGGVAADAEVQFAESEREATGNESSTQSADEQSSEGAITFTAPELELGLLVLIGFLLYSVWVAVQTFEIWAFTAVGAVGAAFLLLSALYVSGRLASESGAEADASTAVESESDLDSTTVSERLATARCHAESVRQAAGANGSGSTGGDALAAPDGTEITASGGTPTSGQEATNDD